MVDAPAGNARRLCDCDRRDPQRGEFCEAAFSYVGLDYQNYVVVDPLYLRPTEVDLLVGDASKARKAFGWQPRTSFRELVEMMVDSDIELFNRQHRL